MFACRSLIAFVTLAACLAVLAVGTAGAATPGEVSTFPIAPCFGNQMAAAPSGVYVRTCDEGDFESSTTLTNLLPDGGLTATAVPVSGAGPIATGPAGEVWTGRHRRRRRRLGARMGAGAARRAGTQSEAVTP